MAPILASMDTLVGHTALKIQSFPSLGYEFSLGTSLAMISRDDFKVSYVWKKSDKFTYYFPYIYNHGKQHKMLISET